MNLHTQQRMYLIYNNIMFETSNNLIFYHYDLFHFPHIIYNIITITTMANRLNSLRNKNTAGLF